MAIYNGNPISSKSNSGLIPLEHHFHQNKSPKPKKGGISHLGLLNILTYLGEMALLMVPGVGEAVSFQIGIALAGATTRLGLAVGNHQVNTITEAIDFGSAFLPGLNAGIENAKLSKAISSEKTQQFLSELMRSNRDELEANGLRLEERVQQELASYGQKKLMYQQRAKEMYAKMVNKSLESNAKAYERNIKWLEKRVKEAEKFADTRAVKYYKEALRFTKNFDPLTHPKKFRDLYEWRAFRKDGINVRNMKEYGYSEKNWTQFKQFRETQNRFGKGQYALTRQRMKTLLTGRNPKMFNDALTELAHDWSKGIILPWKQVVEHKNGAFESFFDILLKDNEGDIQTKIAKWEMEFEAKEKAAEERLWNNLYKHDRQLDERLGKFKDFRVSTALKKQLENHSMRQKSVIWDNSLIDNIAKKLAHIKPSFKTDKGYIFKMINRDLDILNKPQSEMIERYILVSTKQKERMLSFQIYQRLLKELFDGVENEQEKDVLRALFRAMGKLSYHKLSQLFEATQKVISKETFEKEGQILSEAFEQGTGYFYKANWYEKFAKKYHLGDSTKFRYFKVGKYGKFGRLRNMINPMTLARAVPDAIYQTLKNYFDRKTVSTFEKSDQWLKKKLTDEEKALKLTGDKDKAEDLLKQEQASKKLFVKNGGILVAPNRYLLGFKVIPSPLEVEGEQTILFVFNKLHTGTMKRSSKNYGGKKDVLVIATDEDIANLIEFGVDYYWRVGGEKGWYINRGGKQHQNFLDSVAASSFSLYLGFLPTNQLRQIITLTSSTEYETLRWIKGQNEKHLGNKMFSTMFRTALNRLGRLAARYPIPKVSAMFAGRSVVSDFDKGVIGKEFQRYVSMSLALTIQTSTSDGSLKVGLPSTQKLLTRLEITGAHSAMRQGFTRHRYTSQLVMHTDHRGRQRLVRKSNNYYGSTIRQIKSAQRRMGYVSRIKGIGYSRALKGGTHIGQIKW